MMITISYWSLRLPAIVNMIEYSILTIITTVSPHNTKAIITDSNG